MLAAGWGLKKNTASSISHPNWTQNGSQTAQVHDNQLFQFYQLSTLKQNSSLYWRSPSDSSLHSAIHGFLPSRPGSYGGFGYKYYNVHGARITLFQFGHLCTSGPQILLYEGFCKLVNQENFLKIYITEH